MYPLSIHLLFLRSYSCLTKIPVAEVYGVDWNGVAGDSFLSSSWDNTLKLWAPGNDASIQTWAEHQVFKFIPIT